MHDRVLGRHAREPFRFLDDVAELAFADARAPRARQQRGQEEFRGEGEGFEILLQRARRRFGDGLFDRCDGDFAHCALLLLLLLLSRTSCAVFVPVSLSRRKGALIAPFAGCVEKGIVGRVVGFGFGDLDGSPADVEGAPGVAGDGGHFAASELDGVWVNDVCGDGGEARLDDLLELLVGVAREGDSGKT